MSEGLRLLVLVMAGASVVACEDPAVTSTVVDAAADGTTATCPDVFEFRASSRGTSYDEAWETLSLESKSPDASVLVQFFDSFFGGGPWKPGVYPIGANLPDKDYQTCSTCVFFCSQCDAQSCSKFFFAVAGTIEITEVASDKEYGYTVSAGLKNIRAVEVTVDADLDTCTSIMLSDRRPQATFVPNGDALCIDSLDL